MPRTVSRNSSRPLLILLIVVLLFGFTPISRVLLQSVDGSFAPNHYTSLALITPSHATVGFLSGEPVPVQFTNETGDARTYHWSATENGALISLGEVTLDNGRASTVFVPSRGALVGKLRISLTGTNIFVTVPIRNS